MSSADGGYDLQIWRKDAIILNKQSQPDYKEWSSSLTVRCGANNSPLFYAFLFTGQLATKCLTRPWNCMCFFRTTQVMENYTFSYGNGNENHELGTALPVHMGNTSAVREDKVC
jgi:hypothetical protein